jgi:excisionase family DNA binding protein
MKAASVDLAVEDLPNLVSLRRASAQTRIPRATLRRAVERGEIPGYRYGARTIRVRAADVLAWVAAGRVASSRSAPPPLSEHAAELARAMRGRDERARRRRGGRR